MRPTRSAVLSTVRRSLAPTLVASLLAATLAGCIVAPARPYYAGPIVAVAPPPPQYERVGPPPVAGYVWLGGYWAWRDNRHEWVAGRWEAPRAGYRWVPHEWVRDGTGWRFREGRWER